jgi:predicted transcriptional regulator
VFVGEGFYMVKYRRRYQIIADIVRAAEKGAKKTKIMYFANLSYRLLQKYLDDSLKVGFIQESEGGYESTDRGRLFLEKYAEFSSKYSKLVNDFEALKFEMEVLERMCGSNVDGNGKVNSFRRKSSEVLL